MITQFYTTCKSSCYPVSSPVVGLFNVAILVVTLDFICQLDEVMECPGTWLNIICGLGSEDTYGDENLNWWIK